jgi:predicted TIM-barrel fold metal-dependent hydrolase
MGSDVPRGRVVDFHFHAGGPEDWHPWVIGFIEGVNPTAAADLARCQTQEGLLAFLDAQGVDAAVVLAEESPITTGVVTNERVRDLCQGSDRLVPFASFDPNRVDDPAGELRRLVEADGFRGLKLYPSYQHFFPDDPGLSPLFAAAADLGVVAMFHTGTSIYRGSRQRYSEPMRLDDLATDLPDLAIVMAHSGRRLWYDQAQFLAERHDNVYLELSGIPPRRVPEVLPRLDRVADRVLFGSDFPGVPSIRGNLEAFRGLYSPGLVEAILGGNARRLLRLG